LPPSASALDTVRVKKGTSAQASIHISAPPRAVYDLVSDVTRMGELSPETVRCRWLDGVTGPAVGARFRGTNRRLIFRWSTTPEVVAAEPGREFAFLVPLIVFHRPMTTWRYRMQPASGGGTDLTESFEMVDDIPWYIRLSQRFFIGTRDRKADLEAGMRKTLERIKTVAERGA
jgi:hypothetical protein